MASRPVERRRDERGEGAEIWSEDDRKILLKIAPLFEKWNNRGGKKKETKNDDRSFLELLGIK
jgi:hypothetical protein